MGQTMSLRLSRESGSVKIARDALRSVPELGERAGDARLVASELVTNAIKYGRGDILLDVVVTDDQARLMVSDDGEGEPRILEAAGQHGGWGLRMVDTLADRWGIIDGSAHVWVELAL